MASINKPTFVVAPGHSFNSGASLFQAAGIPCTLADSKMAFNEVTFGYVPHGGATFYLSRLPNEIGTFLALTGLQIPGADIQGFGLSDLVIHEQRDFDKDLRLLMTGIETPIPNPSAITDRFRLNPWKTQMKARIEAENQQLFQD